MLIQDIYPGQKVYDNITGKKGIVYSIINKQNIWVSLWFDDKVENTIDVQRKPEQIRSV